jgi:hypothetical protein
MFVDEPGTREYTSHVMKSAVILELILGSRELG